MDPEITNYIDYYLQNKGVSELVYTSALAVILSFVALITTTYMFFVQRKAQVYDRLSKDWNDIVRTSTTNPSFFDIRITEQYFSKMEGKDLIAYEPFCLIVWGLVEEIVSLGYYKHKEFAPILQWAVAYHIAWLERNPIFFRKKEFWSEIENLRKQPQSVTRYSPIPKNSDGSANWDAVAETYFDYILSPFDPIMFSGKKRNPIGDDIVEYSEKVLKGKDHITLMDHGCGIGNLYPKIRGDITNKLRVIGVDWSEIALEFARKESDGKFKEFIPEKIDFRDPGLVEKYGEESVDIMVSVASLSLENWESVNQSLTNISRLLRPGGIFFIIVPAFEAIDEWLSLWTTYYEKEYGKKHSQRIKDSWEKNKQFNRNEHTYAEDGTYPQCFFSKVRLQELLTKFHGMSLDKDPQRIFYPWELINRFDYGLYNDTKFELYDWYVIGKKKL